MSRAWVKQEAARRHYILYIGTSRWCGIPRMTYARCSVVARNKRRGIRNALLHWLRGPILCIVSHTRDAHIILGLLAGAGGTHTRRAAYITSRLSRDVRASHTTGRGPATKLPPFSLLVITPRVYSYILYTGWWLPCPAGRIYLGCARGTRAHIYVCVNWKFTLLSRAVARATTASPARHAHLPSKLTRHTSFHLYWFCYYYI